MNKFGLHMLVYTADWSESGARRLFEKAATMGYDFVEVLIFNPDTVDAAMTARLAKEYGVGVAAGLCGTLAADLSNADPVVAKRGEEWVSRAIAKARDMGATMLGGPTFSAVHRYMLAPSEFARERAVLSYRRLAEQAKAAGVRIGLEALNRYESNFINTVGQAADLCRKVGSDAMFVHGDMFHMNIEEGDIGQALVDVKDCLGYVHVAESHRGYLGTGNTDWSKFFDALARIGYDGPITFESFSPTVLGPELAGLIALWRDHWTDPDDVAAKALAFMRNGVKNAVATVR
jgi:D-psicose/D-tagatose/L-ribulose 3-epimerase